MLKKIKNIILSTDRFLYKKFGTFKSLKLLENIKEAKIIFSHLNIIGEETKVRFVGGCVRKVLCGEVVDDIDLATSLEPEEVKTKLTNKNIKTVDVGLSHGTITAIVNDKKFEITTLRKDIMTDGRHAKVEFTKDLAMDASRRDFTINAIYADIDGRIYDPLSGRLDLKKGIVKFIGSPEERIKEDYLRILRYFRFFNEYSFVEHDNNTIKSIKKNINGLNKISNERIFNELNKILKSNKLYNLFLNSESNEIILSIFPQLKYYKRLKIKESCEKELINKYDNCLILALLILDGSNEYEYFCYKYKVSNETKNRLKKISDNYDNLKNKKFYSKENIKKFIYKSSKKDVIDLLLFAHCELNKSKKINIKELMYFINTIKIPKFPISGDYLKKYGYKAGKELGEKLKLLEDKWITNNFTIDEEMIEKLLGKSSHN